MRSFHSLLDERRLEGLVELAIALVAPDASQGEPLVAVARLRNTN